MVAAQPVGEESGHAVRDQFASATPGRVLGSEERSSLRTGIDFVSKDGCDEVPEQHDGAACLGFA
jgi:hypothetical protein